MLHDFARSMGNSGFNYIRMLTVVGEDGLVPDTSGQIGCNCRPCLSFADLDIELANWHVISNGLLDRIDMFPPDIVVTRTGLI